MAFHRLPHWTLYQTIVVAQVAFVALSPSSPLLRTGNLPDGRIINGTEALQNNTKYQVSIRNRTTDAAYYGSGHKCGGSLISDNVVLCSATCFLDYGFLNGSFMDDDSFIVVMGNVNRYQQDNNTLVFDIKTVVKYNEVFNMNTLQQNLVLVMLNGSVPVDHPTVKPINLPEGPLLNAAVCKFTGWGATADSNNSTELLMTVDLPIIPYDVCFKETDNSPWLSEDMLCAGYLEGGSGPCTNDAGGPLVCNDLQVGIASWSYGCAEANRPSVFTDVAFYKNWILSKVAEYNGTLPIFVTQTGDNTDTIDGQHGDGAGAMAMYNNSIFLVIFIIVFNVVLCSF